MLPRLAIYTRETCVWKKLAKFFAPVFLRSFLYSVCVSVEKDHQGGESQSHETFREESSPPPLLLLPASLRSLDWTLAKCARGSV